MPRYIFLAQVAQMKFLDPIPQGHEYVWYSWFYWIYLIILDKMAHFLWKLELGFWTYGLKRFLGLSFNFDWPPYLESQHVQYVQYAQCVVLKKMVYFKTAD